MHRKKRTIRAKKRDKTKVNPLKGCVFATSRSTTW